MTQKTHQNMMFQKCGKTNFDLTTNSIQPFFKRNLLLVCPVGRLLCEVRQHFFIWICSTVPWCLIRAYLERVSTVQRRRTQMLQILSPWTRVCPVRTAAMRKETPFARSFLIDLWREFFFLPLKKAHMPSAALWHNQHSVFLDLRGVWRRSDGVWGRLQQTVSPGMSRLVCAPWRQIHLLGM